MSALPDAGTEPRQRDPANPLREAGAALVLAEARKALFEKLASHRATPPHNLRSRQRPRDPSGRCYELAGRYFLEHHSTDGVRLVHGFVAWFRGELQMAHAWVELPADLIYDRGAFFVGAGYRHVMKPEPIRIWTSGKDFAIGMGAYWAPCADLQAEKDRRGAP